MNWLEVLEVWLEVPPSYQLNAWISFHNFKTTFALIAYKLKFVVKHDQYFNVKFLIDEHLHIQRKQKYTDFAKLSSPNKSKLV